MDSKRTIHILLAIIAVGLFFIIFIYMKDNYFNRSNTESVVWEETVPARPSTTPTPKPTPTPTPTPTPVPTQQNIELVVGNSYLISFSVPDEHTRSYKYCGDTNSYNFGNYFDKAQIFVSLNDSCSSENSEKIHVSLSQFIVSMKKGSANKAALEALNTQYSVDIDDELLFGNSDTASYHLKIRPESGLNSYTLSKIYFDTGKFISVGPNNASGGTNN